ncbi:hypothetical protein ACR80L_09515 [Bacillus velezensis]|uniref:hypothetical protein n=1 Tax=Bacillus velezensis TaxID=492670 RepID=UPI00052A4FF9|nr:hypothetical protein [Bacillus velezensis]AIU77432.1 hypothetical protein MA22_13215 [Bacillus subtilis]AOO61809.1 hypothetical protein BBJ33_09755 [Bacillus velezensis]NGM58526.1 hypothetical protein [Bacillus velezensis]
MEDLIKELNEKNQEISNKDFEIRELIKQQVTLIRKYLNEYSKVINFYLENHMKFFHPDFNVSTEKGPILAYIEKTKDMIIYKKDSDDFVLYNPNSSFNQKTERFLSLREIVEGGHFNSAIRGITYTTKKQDELIQERENLIARLTGEISEAERKLEFWQTNGRNMAR